MAENGKYGLSFPLAQALAHGRKVAEAARELGIPERTAYRWAQNPKFRRRVARLQLNMSQAALGQMSDGMAEAAAALRQLVAEGDHNVKLKAARTLLDLGSRLRETVEFESRLVELEQRQAGGAT